jgi:ERF superfamily
MTDAVPAAPRRRRANGQHPPPARMPAKPGSLLEAIILAASDPSIDIAKVEHLVRLKKEMDAAEAERLFNEALAAAQAEMVPIVADAVNSEVGRAHRYASYAQLDRAVRPIYSRHGLSVTFNTGERSTDAVVEVTCYLCGHGHGRRYSILMPADGKGARGGDVMSRTHAAASAISYGMRYILVMAFNLAVDRDDDGNAAGRLPAQKSSAQLKREGVWPQFEAEMRAATSLQALQAVVERWRPRVQQWSNKWKGAAEELHGQCQERLGGTLAALKESAARLDTPSPPPHWEG